MDLINASMDELMAAPVDDVMHAMMHVLELSAQSAVIAPVDYVNINIELAGSGDDPRLNTDNDDEDIQSPTEDSEDLTQFIEVPIHNQLTNYM